MSGDYSAGDEDQVIHYEDIKVISTTLTPINWVRNDIKLRYAFDYAEEKTLERTGGSTDATSQGTTVNGFNQTLKMRKDMNTSLDSTTVGKYEDALLNFFKDRKNDLIIESSNPTQQALEVGDITVFADWPSTYKVNNTTISQTANFFQVLETSKKDPGITSLKLIQVS